MLSKAYSFLDKIYNSKFFLIFYRAIKILINILMPLNYMLSKKRQWNENSTVIISLTTFPARIKSVHLVIESLLRQTEMPKAIVLYLSKSQFESFQELPLRLRRLHKKGYVNIRFVEDDYKPHKKYFYAVQEYNDYNLITVDDDIFYPENLVECLLNSSKQHNNAICCLLAKKITVKNHIISAYDEWTTKGIDLDIPRWNLIPIGCAGIYYPKGCFNKEILLNTKLIFELCPKADDIWLRTNTLLNNQLVVKSGKYKNFVFVDIIIPNNERLCEKNVANKENDIQMKKVVSFFPEIIELLERE